MLPYKILSYSAADIYVKLDGMVNSPHFEHSDTMDYTLY